MRMVRPSDISPTIEQIAGCDTVILTDISTVYKYENGKRTDTIDGFRNTVVAPSKKYTEFTIKTPQAVVTPEQLAAAKEGVIKVRVKGFQGRFYPLRNKEGKVEDYNFTSIAEALEIIT